MATKKREIYARVATQLRGHERAIKAERACPGAMGLYLFLLLDSRGEQTAGDVAEEVADTSWGGKESYRRKQADALVAVGLVTRVDGRLHVVKYDEHNDTPADIETAKAKARDRMLNVRNPERCSPPVQRTEPEHTEDVPSSSSSSSSLSGVDLGSGSPPAWFGAALETVEVQTGEKLRPPDSWLRYSGHRANKGIPPTQQDAVYWLATVMVPEARKERRAEADKRERDEKFDRARGGIVEPQKLTAEQQRELAEKFPMRRRDRGNAA